MKGCKVANPDIAVDYSHAHRFEKSSSCDYCSIFRKHRTADFDVYF